MGDTRRRTGGTQDTVTVILDRRTAENHYYALALALGAAGPAYRGEDGKGGGKGKYPGKTPPKGKAPGNPPPKGKAPGYAPSKVKPPGNTPPKVKDPVKKPPKRKVSKRNTR